MIVTINEVYEKVAEKNSVDFDIVQSIGSAVFSSLRENLERRDELAYEVYKIGSFILRQQKLETSIINNPNNLASLSEEDRNGAIAVYEKIKKFREEKQKKRKLRDEQVEANKSSKDNSTQHEEVHSGVVEMDDVQIGENKISEQGGATPSSTLPD